VSDATARIIQKAIPDSLRLNEHPDAKLVCDAIATVLVAIRESDSITLNGQATDINAALSKYDESVFKPHITQEDEDWNAIKAKAALAPTPVERAVSMYGSASNGDEYWNAADYAASIEPLTREDRVKIHHASVRAQKRIGGMDPDAPPVPVPVIEG